MTSPPPSPVRFPPVPPDVPGLLRALLADPGRPRVTWYGPGGERVELSGKVLDNWVAKSANLLVDELDAGPGSAVLVDLPGHWRTVCWLLAIWATGAAAVLPSPLPPSPRPPSPDVTGRDVPGPVLPGRNVPGPVLPGTVPAVPPALHPDAVVTTRPERWADDTTGPFAGASLLAVALPALATRFTGPLPAGTVDAATEVRSHGDVFLPAVRPTPQDVAVLTVDGEPVTHGNLLTGAAAAAAASGLPAGARLLTGSGPDRVVDTWLAALVVGGSLVLHHDLPGPDDPARARLIAQEGVQVVA